jgi:hypothetical protein
MTSTATRVRKLIKIAARKLGDSSSTGYMAFFDGARMDHDMSIGSYKVGNGDCITVRAEQETQ